MNNNSITRKLHALFGTDIIPAPARSIPYIPPRILESSVIAGMGTQTGLGVIPTTKPRPETPFETTPSHFQPSPRLKPTASKELRKTLSSLGIDMPEHVSSMEFPLFIELATAKMKLEGKELKPEQRLTMMSNISDHIGTSAARNFNTVYPVGGVERTKLDSDGKTLEVFNQFQEKELQNLMAKLPGLKDFFGSVEKSGVGIEGQGAKSVSPTEEKVWYEVGGKQNWIPADREQEFLKKYSNAKKINKK